jgi:hypothetical protein
MLHISIKIGQTLKIDGTQYQLKEVDHLNGGAKLKITQPDKTEEDQWVYIGEDSIAIDDSSELAMHSIAPDFQTYAKLTLISDRIHDVTFP